VDAFTAVLWIPATGFVLCLYLFLFLVVRSLWRDLRCRGERGALGRSAHRRGLALGRPVAGTSIPIVAVTSLGGDVNNTVVVEDPVVAAEHAV